MARFVESAESRAQLRLGERYGDEYRQGDLVLKPIQKQDTAGRWDNITLLRLEPDGVWVPANTHRS